jgi:hypothetical protein
VTPRPPRLRVRYTTSVGKPKEIPRYGCTQPAWNDAGGGYALCARHHIPVPQMTCARIKGNYRNDNSQNQILARSCKINRIPHRYSQKDALCVITVSASTLSTTPYTGPISPKSWPAKPITKPHALPATARCLASAYLEKPLITGRLRCTGIPVMSHIISLALM